MSHPRAWLVAAAFLVSFGPHPFFASPPRKTGCVDKTIPSCYQTIQAAINSPGVVDGDIIRISAHVYEERIVVSKNLLLIGKTSDEYPPITTTIRGVSEGQSLVFVPQGKTVTLEGIRITNGNTSFRGGGITNYGTLSLRGVTVDHNWAASGPGGGIYSEGMMTMLASRVYMNSTGGGGGGIYSKGSLATDNCQVDHNTAGMNGGGLDLEGVIHLRETDVSSNTAIRGGGGINLHYTQFEMTDGNIAGNLAGMDGGGMDIYGSFAPGGPGYINLDRVTLSNNTASAGDGGGIYNWGGTLSLTNVTMSGNSAISGSGGALCYTQGGFGGSPVPTTIRSSTFAYNRASAGGGSAIGKGSFDGPQPAVVIIASSILSNNAGSNCGTSDPPNIDSYDYNLSDDDTCHLHMHADLEGESASLNPLALNAPGRVMTHALRIGSPADDLVEACGGTDARGIPRGSPLCDAGAYEGTEPPIYLTIPDARAVVEINATCRLGPSAIYAATGYLSVGETHAITGRNADATWLKLETCWVATGLLLTDEVDLLALPIHEAPLLPVTTQACYPTMGPGECGEFGGTWIRNVGFPGGKCNCP